VEKSHAAKPYVHKKCDTKLLTKKLTDKIRYTIYGYDISKKSSGFSILPIKYSGSICGKDLI
jgi:hypothetical protein